MVTTGAVGVLALLGVLWLAAFSSPWGAPLAATPARPATDLPALPLLRTLDEPADAVGALAFSPDAALLATGGPRREVLFWDTATGRAVRALRQSGFPSAEDSAVTAIAFSRTGATVAAGRLDGNVSLWDTATGHELARRRGAAVASLAFSPDGRTLAVGHAEGTVALWDVAHGRELRVVPAHQGLVAAVAFAPVGASLATGSWDRTVKLWDIATGRELRALSPGYPVSYLTFSPDGRMLAVGGGREVALWDAAAERQPRGLEHPAIVAGIAFSPDGRLLISAASDGGVRSWSVADGQLTGAARGQTTLALAAFAPRRGILAATRIPAPRNGLRDGDATESPVRLWELRQSAAPRRP